MKRIFLIITTFFVFLSLFCEVKLVEYYPKILTLNNDNINEKVFFKYFNDEAKKIVLKIYDINGILLWEEKIGGSLKEKPQDDGSYIFSWSPLEESFYKTKLPQGCYIFVFSDEEKILSKGSFIVIK